MLVTSDGYPRISTDEEPIYIPPEVNISDLIIGERHFSYVNGEGKPLI